MENFIFHNPTKIIFGKNTEECVGEEVSRYSKRVLLHYGGSSIKKSGLYNLVVTKLKEANIEFIELGGVVPNPRLSLVREGIQLCHDHNLDFILAVGGGSVIDSAKAIAAGVKYDGDVWDFFSKGIIMSDSLPLGTILTLPATGSEMNHRCVITNDATLEKRGCSFAYPTFSILDAQLFKTLPKNQVANGLVDIVAHCMERYFSKTQNTEITNRQLEAIMKTVVDLSQSVYQDPSNYDDYAQILWAGTIAHNYSLCVGRQTDWATHAIEHEISGMYDVAHGAGLSVLFPAWLKYVIDEDVALLAQFANRVFNVEVDFHDLKKTALKGIKALEAFYASLDMPLTLKDLGVNYDSIEQLALNSTRNNTISIGNFKKLNSEDVKAILLLAKGE